MMETKMKLLNTEIVQNLCPMTAFSQFAKAPYRKCFFENYTLQLFVLIKNVMNIM